ncbi:hypothetical protein XENORESO_013781 [Xenotaenia resolanae]|uniref:Uncharacterized protein n=1 Tax=Xenotaenia resolanae TaxID=208358 RepID=A0ABV0X452_9TELE
MPLSNGSVSTATSSGVPSVLLQRDPHLCSASEDICRSRLSSFLNGSRLAHLPAIRDDRARPGVRLDAAPQTERQTQNTRSWTSVALKRPDGSGSFEDQQTVGRCEPRGEGPEKNRTNCEKSITRTKANLTETEHTSSFWALIVFSELRDPQLSKQQTVAQHQQKVSPGTVATNECQ